MKEPASIGRGLLYLGLYLLINVGGSFIHWGGSLGLNPMLIRRHLNPADVDISLFKEDDCRAEQGFKEIAVFSNAFSEDVGVKFQLIDTDYTNTNLFKIELLAGQRVAQGFRMMGLVNAIEGKDACSGLIELFNQFFYQSHEELGIL